MRLPLVGSWNGQGMEQTDLVTLQTDVYTTFVNVAKEIQTRRMGLPDDQERQENNWLRR